MQGVSYLFRSSLEKYATGWQGRPLPLKCHGFEALALPTPLWVRCVGRGAVYVGSIFISLDGCSTVLQFHGKFRSTPFRQNTFGCLWTLPLARGINICACFPLSFPSGFHVVRDT